VTQMIKQLDEIRWQLVHSSQVFNLTKSS
jgi:hypothetical protein